MKRDQLQIVGLIVFILAATLACNTVTGIGDRIGDTRGTVEAAVTSVGKGVDILATARAFGTEVGGSGLIETAQALATEVGDSGLVQTAQAFATEQGPALLQTVESVATEQGPAIAETARAFATQEVPGMVETVQAAATQAGPGLMETAQALATQAASSLGEAPADIPLIEGERSQFYGIENLVFYITPATYTDALAFYKEQMPDNGWEKTDQGTLEGDNAAVLMFKKGSRSASVALSINPVDDHTVVLITILGQ
jgi:predicted small secreted protein